MKSLHIFWLITILFGGFNFSSSQVKISEMVQYSKFAKSEENALYLVDFWATWCAPCIHVKKYLGSLQQQYPDNFYIVSLSEENPEKVKRFLSKHHSKLAVALDYDGETFRKNAIRSLPHAMLLNANGNVIWEGHPADFKSYHVDKYLRQNRKKTSVDNIFRAQAIAEDVIEEIYVPSKDFELKEILNSDTMNLEVSKLSSYIKLSGSLKSILSYASKVYEGQIVIPELQNRNYEVYVKEDSESYTNIAMAILSELDLDYEKSQAVGEALVLKIVNPMFWDANQIDWGKGSPSFLVGDSDIKADNITLYDVSHILASAVELPVVIEPNTFEDNDKHDWQIHYRFLDLMKSELKDTYGIEAEKKSTSYAVFKVIKKAP